MFDYDKEIKKITKGINIMNLNGLNRVINILKCLKICPFINVVAEYMNTIPRVLYDVLKYHLPNDVYGELLADLQNRKYLVRENMKSEYQDKLKLVDDNEQNNNENT